MCIRDSIWTVTVNIAQGDHEYKYALGAWVSQESVPADCVNTVGANRAVTVTADVTLDTDVYNGCPGDDTSGGDTGGSDPVIPASPVPTDAADSVLSLFSDAYTDQEGTDFNPNWGQSTQVAVTDVIT